MIIIEHKVCIKCRWNNYPECTGIIMYLGNFMNIEHLKPGFRCGQKDALEVDDLSIKKSDLELRIETLEAKVNELETKEG